jgi:cholesterol transport system auxiliary component
MDRESDLGQAKMQFMNVFRIGQISLLAACCLSLAGCLGGGAPDDTFSLSAATPVEPGVKASKRQILIPEPSALKALNSEQVVIRVNASEIQYLSKARWSDRLPRMVQARLVQAFENTGRLGGVGMPGQGLAIDFQIVTDIRAFEIQNDGGSHARIEISAKILNDRTGEIKATRVFTASAPVSGAGNDAFVKALDAAFSTVTADMIGWTLKSV